MMNRQKIKELPLLTLSINDVEKIREEKIPEGYCVRTFKPGDEAAWERIMFDTYGRKFDFASELKADYAYRPERVIFICHENIPVASVCAWYRPEFGRDAGVIYMPGVSSSRRGKSLELYLALAAVRSIRNEGKKRAIIQVDDFRLEEIELYLEAGFMPLLIHESQRLRWEKVLENIGREDLRDRIPDLNTLEIFAPDFGRVDKDTIERTEYRHKWYPFRQHRCAGGSIDALADESFYKPSLLGEAGTLSREVVAGSTGILRLWFTAGPAGIPEGASVMFCMRGQEPLGCSFQTDSPNEPYYVSISGPNTCSLRPYSNEAYMKIGFIVENGSLSDGDTVQITAGYPDGFTWTPIAGRYELKVVINYGNAEPERRLPEPVIINVLPCEPDKLEVTMPCTRKNGEDVSVHITARDKFDNRVPLSGKVEVKYAGKIIQTNMLDGLADCVVKPGNSELFTVSASHSDIEKKYESNPNIVTADGLNLYIGDLHCHDFFSEAQGYTDSIYRWAIEDKNLDFVSLSVQTHGWIDNEKWTVIKYMNERFLNEGKFVTLLANEWQHTGYGDKIIHFLGGDHPFLCVDDERYNSAPKLYEALRSCDAVVIGHHTAYPPGAWCPANDFDYVETDVERLVEIWSMHGSSEGFELDDRPLFKYDANYTAMAALRRGLKLGFVAGSDTHCGRPGGSAKEPLGYWGGLAAVWAESLTRRSIFEALKARRTYALTGARIILKMTVNGELMGGELPPSDNAEIKIDVWAPSKIKKVQVIKNTNLLVEFDCSDRKFHKTVSDRTGGAAYYHCRVIQEDGHLAVCSPVWIG